MASPTLGSFTYVTSVNSSAANCVMPMVTMSPSALCHSCDCRYLRSVGTDMVSSDCQGRRLIQLGPFPQSAIGNRRPALCRSLIERQLHNLRRVQRAFQVGSQLGALGGVIGIDEGHGDALLQRGAEGAAGGLADDRAIGGFNRRALAGDAAAVQLQADEA